MDAEALAKSVARWDFQIWKKLKIKHVYYFSLNARIMFFMSDFINQKKKETTLLIH